MLRLLELTIFWEPIIVYGQMLRQSKLTILCVSTIGHGQMLRQSQLTILRVLKICHGQMVRQLHCFPASRCCKGFFSPYFMALSGFVSQLTIPVCR